MIFAVKKIIAAFLLPPGCFILFLFVCAVFQLRRSRYVTAATFLLPAILLWSLSTSVVSNSVSESLERGIPIPAHPKGDVIVLLSGGNYDRVPDISGSGAPTEQTLARLVTAVRLQRRLGLPILVSGGAVYTGRTPEALVIKRFLLDLGISPQSILIEDKSRDTIENARYSKALLLQKGFSKPILVTSVVHMRRSIEAFRAVGVKVTPVPSQFVTAPGRPLLWADFLPEAGGLSKTSSVFHEYLGLIYNFLAGKGSS